MSTSVSPVLKVSNLCKAFGRQQALSRVSLDVRGGEVLGIIGPNGAGKTTLFECVAGTLPADSGEIAVTGQMFYLPDAIAPWPSQTVQWALQFVPGFFAGADGVNAARVATVIVTFKLTELLNRPIGALSKGQRKRAMLAIALLTPAPILLVDEPFEGLDLRQSREVAAALRAEAAAGRTLFLSIHQMADAVRVCDRFILLSGGVVKGAGTLDELSVMAGTQGQAGARDLEEVFLALT